MELKDQIRIHRESAGMSQAEFAEALGVSVQTITSGETGEHRPQLNHIKAINKVLGVDLDITEQGDATRPDRKKTLALDPECLRMAVAIGKLTKDQKDSIKTLIMVGEAMAQGKKGSTINCSGKLPGKSVVTKYKNVNDKGETEVSLVNVGDQKSWPIHSEKLLKLDNFVKAGEISERAYKFLRENLFQINS